MLWFSSGSDFSRRAEPLVPPLHGDRSVDVRRTRCGLRVLKT